MEDFKILYEKAVGHRNALAIRNAGMEFDLAMANEHVAALEEQIKSLQTELDKGEDVWLPPS